MFHVEISQLESIWDSWVGEEWWQRAHDGMWPKMVCGGILGDQTLGPLPALPTPRPSSETIALCYTAAYLVFT